MTIEIKADNAQQAEAMVREAYNNLGYILDAEYFTDVDFTTREKEMATRIKGQKYRGQER